jgi:hypothetical protein
MNDPMYEDVPQRLRAMSEQQLVIEERQASASLTQLVIEHQYDSQNDTPEGLAIELRLMEAQLALNLRVRDNTIAAETAKERARGGVTPEAEELIRSLAHGTFRKDIDRIHFQLMQCREKLSTALAHHS